MNSHRKMSPDEALATAVDVFACLTERPDAIDRFLRETGLTPATLRAATAAPGFFPAVLDHVAADEALLLAIARQLGAHPAQIAEARAILDAP
jgi:Protein of unknown function (DUF3572)